MDYYTARLHVRDLCWDDLNAIHAFKVDPVVTRYTDFGVSAMDESRDWLAGCIHHNTILHRVAHNCAIVLLGHENIPDETIGWIGFGPPSDNQHGDIDFGYALRREFWGNGYMTEALAGMIDFIFTTSSVQSIFGECETANPASASVMEKAGMVLVEQYTWRAETTGQLIASLRYRINKTDWQSTAL